MYFPILNRIDIVVTPALYTPTTSHTASTVQLLGMDPSPKAWEAIMAGTIPIIQRSVLDDAYSHLPVAFVDSWEELLQPANYSALEIRMRNWMKDLQPYYAQGSALRRKTLDVRKDNF